MVITDNLSFLHFLPFILLFALTPSTSIHLNIIFWQLCLSIRILGNLAALIERKNEDKSLFLLPSMTIGNVLGGKMMGHLNEENIYLNYVVVFRQRFNDNKTRSVKQIIKK